MFARPAERPTAAAILRLSALVPLDSQAIAALDAALLRPRKYRPRRELMAEGQEIRETLLILSGWGARVRILEDGRRQILDFLLPGDLIGHGTYERALAPSTVIAITDIDVAVAPDADVSPTLTQAYALSRAMGEAYLLAQITRLGRLNAHERIASLLLELLERLELAGMSAGGRYVMPLTQEVIADALGLTSVHVNRTLQGLRRQGELTWKGRELILPDPAALRQSIGHVQVRVARN